jgi:osmotically-inducible protein OsmY
MRNTFQITQALVLAGLLGTANVGYAQAVAAQPVTPDTLEQAIDQRWEADATLKACKSCDLDVEITGDVAKLTGEVPTAALKARAARLANVTGVARVDNQIQVVVPTSAADKTREGLGKAANKTADGVDKAADETAKGVGKAADKTGDALAKTGEVMDDTWVTTKVKAKYVGEKSVEGSDISVETNQNVVTLSGTVPTAAAHAAALRIARDTKGVKRVVDNLRVAPKTN